MEDNPKHSDVPPEILQKALRSASKRAVDETFALGLTILIERDGKLVELFPDGTERDVPAEENEKP